VRVYIQKKMAVLGSAQRYIYASDHPEGPTSEKRILIPTLLHPSASTQGVVTRRVRLLGHIPSLHLAFC
jgi:hypothetical protein